MVVKSIHQVKEPKMGPINPLLLKSKLVKPKAGKKIQGACITADRRLAGDKKELSSTKHYFEFTEFNYGKDITNACNKDRTFFAFGLELNKCMYKNLDIYGYGGPYVIYSMESTCDYVSADGKSLAATDCSKTLHANYFADENCCDEHTCESADLYYETIDGCLDGEGIVTEAVVTEPLRNKPAGIVFGTFPTTHDCKTLHWEQIESYMFIPGNVCYSGSLPGNTANPEGYYVKFTDCVDGVAKLNYYATNDGECTGQPLGSHTLSTTNTCKSWQWGYYEYTYGLMSVQCVNY